MTKNILVTGGAGYIGSACPTPLTLISDMQPTTADIRRRFCISRFSMLTVSLCVCITLELSV